MHLRRPGWVRLLLLRVRQDGNIGLVPHFGQRQASKWHESTWGILFCQSSDGKLGNANCIEKGAPLAPTTFNCLFMTEDTSETTVKSNYKDSWTTAERWGGRKCQDLSQVQRCSFNKATQNTGNLKTKLYIISAKHFSYSTDYDNYKSKSVCNL